MTRTTTTKELRYYHRPEPAQGEDFIVTACDEHAPLLRAHRFQDGAGDLTADLAEFNDGKPGGNCAFCRGGAAAFLRELGACTCEASRRCPVHPREGSR